MVIKKLMISMMVLLAGATPIAAGATPIVADAAPIAVGAESIAVDAAIPANTSTAMAVESSNSYYAYSTESIMQMGIVQIGGQEYALPLTMKQLAADGWKKFGLRKTKPGEPYVVSRDDMQLSLSEDQQGVIERIVELYPSSGTLVIPADSDVKDGNGEVDPAGAGIRIGISEEDLIDSLNQLSLSWECAHLKNGTTKYKVLVPLGGPERIPDDEAAQIVDGGAAQTVDSASAQSVDSISAQIVDSISAQTVDSTAARAYPACEFVITAGDRQTKVVEIRMISDPGTNGWADEILGFRAAAYYEKKAGEMPPLFRVEEQKDGRVLIRLFESLEDHIATWALYKLDRTGKGYDEAFDPNEKKVIDFMN